MRKLTIIGLFGLLMAASATVGFSQTNLTLERGAPKFISAGKFTVKFIEVVEDSRCPPDVNCVWAGNAKVRISIAKGKASPRIFELNSNSEPSEIKFGGATFKFVDLSRDPGEESNDQIVKPRLTIQINRAK